jgi:hypothetical protein
MIGRAATRSNRGYPLLPRPTQFLARFPFSLFAVAAQPFFLAGVLSSVVLVVVF